MTSRLAFRLLCLKCSHGSFEVVSSNCPVGSQHPRPNLCKGCDLNDDLISSAQWFLVEKQQALNSGMCMYT